MDIVVLFWGIHKSGKHGDSLCPNIHAQPIWIVCTQLCEMTWYYYLLYHFLCRLCFLSTVLEHADPGISWKNVKIVSLQHLFSISWGMGLQCEHSHQGGTASPSTVEPCCWPDWLPSPPSETPSCDCTLASPDMSSSFPSSRSPVFSSKSSSAILRFHCGILQSIWRGVNLECIDAYAVLKWANNTKLHVFATKHKANTYCTVNN